MKEFYRKRFFPLFTLFLIPLFALSLFSCSMLEADSPSSSVSFTFSGEFVQSIRGGVSSRAALGESGTENLSVEISLSGSYTATKTAPLSEGTTVTFSEIPVGSKIRANGQIYSVLEESEKEILYTGESEEITIREGENRLALKMKKAESESTTAEYTVTFNTNDGTEAETQTVAKGEKATRPTDPTKESTASAKFAFEDWYTSTDGGTTLSETPFDFDTEITADTTLYAKWLEITGIATLPETAGAYYLTQDITISETWSVPSGETTLDLNGYGIRMTGSNSVIKVGSGNTLTISDSDTSKTHAITLSSYKGTAVADESGTTSVSDGTGTAYITGGYITGGTGTSLYNKRLGGGVCVDGGTFVMNGGTIIGNSLTDGNDKGAGVWVGNNGEFIMNSGAIQYNKAPNVGGGVCIGIVGSSDKQGNFTMNGGEISYNTANTGGGICIRTDCSFTINGGRIVHNASKTMGGGVDFDTGNVSFSGNPVIKDNQTTYSSNTYADNFCIRGTAKITVGGTLTDDADIHIFFASGWLSSFTAGEFTSSTNTSFNDASKFTSDASGYTVIKNADGQLELASQ